MQHDTEQSIEAVVCIPTFRRPDGLAQTLQSLLKQQGGVAFAIVVVENDAQNPVGAKCAETVLKDSGIPFRIAVEPQQGNCHAINRAFSEARASFPLADYFLMIDDDEVATANWLFDMVATARQNGANIVGGPVIRRFEIPVSASISQHGLNGHIDGPTRRVPAIHGSGNCLIQRRVFAELDSPLFDTSFNFLGGGDMEFFVRCRLAGFVFWWCQTAVILETVAKERSTAAWLLRRSIRTGSINYVIDRKHARTPATRAKLFAKNIVSPGLGILRGLALFARTGLLLPATHPMLMPLGRLTASFGVLPTPYKANAIAAPANDAQGMPASNRPSRTEA